MGLIFSRLKFLLDAKKDGVDFHKTVMVGRQKISLSFRENQKLIKNYILSNKFNQSDLQKRGYSEDILKEYLEVNKLKTLDYSDYEGADIVLDLNYPIKEKYYNNFDTLIDGGSIEHIFNFPMAIENYMKMVKLGGSIFIFTNANNHCGHGFYQFSPEIFFSIFNKSNGFETKSINFIEHPYPGAEFSEKQVCYNVKSPSELGKRSTLVNKSPLGIMVHAIKIKHEKIFQYYPIQSDYEGLSKGNKVKVQKRSKINNFLRYLLNFLPISIVNRIRGLRQLYKYSLKNNKEFFTKLR